MVGITAYGIYLPRYRIKRKDILQSMAWINPSMWAVSKGERTVANYDEDAITLAVSSIRNIPARNFDNFLKNDKKVLIVASRSFPYAERLNSAIVSEAVGCGEYVETVDFSGSPRASVSALVTSLQQAMSSDSFAAIVSSGEVNKAKPGSLDEAYMGDGGCAVMIGRESVIASYHSSMSFSFDFPSEVRSASKTFHRSWEERWIRDEGYKKQITFAVETYLKKNGSSPTHFRYVILPCRYGREHKTIARLLGFQDEQIVPNLIDEIGDTGTVHPLLMLCYALERSSPGDQILIVGYGSGVDIIHFEVSPEIKNYVPAISFEKALARKAQITYEKMVSFREILPVEKGIRGEFQPETPMSVLWRNRKTILGLVGSRCKKCGLPQYPPQKICVNPDCLSSGNMEPYSFSRKAAKIFSYTGDNLAFSMDPPQIYGIVDFDGGGRMMLDFTDCNLNELKVGMNVELTFRRKYHDEHRGVHSYFWKATPRIT